MAEPVDPIVAVVLKDDSLYLTDCSGWSSCGQLWGTIRTLAPLPALAPGLTAPAVQTTSPHLPAPAPAPAVVNDNPMDFDKDLTDADVARYVSLPIEDQFRYEDSFRKGMARTKVDHCERGPVERLGNLRRRQDQNQIGEKSMAVSDRHGCCALGNARIPPPDFHQPVSYGLRQPEPGTGRAGKLCESRTPSGQYYFEHAYHQHRRRLARCNSRTPRVGTVDG